MDFSNIQKTFAFNCYLSTTTKKQSKIIIISYISLCQHHVVVRRQDANIYLLY